MDLVVDKIECKNRFEILGAWKAGCIRESINGEDYTDTKGKYYNFTKRWNYNAPVSRLAWEKLNEIEKTLFSEIPYEFPQTEPPIINKLKEIKGLGFVLSIFILHSFYPLIYPIYDQHVYRAYRNRAKNDKSPIKQAPQRWKDYAEYRDYFIQIQEETNLYPWVIDRGLWVLGKKLSATNTRRKMNIMPHKNDHNPEGWIELQTLSKRNDFKWRITSNNNIDIKREKIKFIESIKCEEIESLFDFMNNKWVPLANSVSKVHDGTEKEGIGNYLYKKHNYSETKQQLSSHLSAIFFKSNIWDYNGLKRNMQFKIKIYAWKSALKDFYRVQQTNYCS
jgi:hypothetical protein